ncbi:MAG TPA: bifunctional ornithine acetyltransferase/N-acetylglutamate synthase [Archaeoglobus veneficus]|nr:bifunctional ornithine acetyltransferase/N-acetylglutamate synthase [Archaeoglobus veneficus]
MIKRINGSIENIENLTFNGIKEGKNGLGIVVCKGNVAGVFTKNKIKAAPVKVTMDVVRNGEIEGLIVNSGNANAFTGDLGLENSKKMALLLAEKLEVDEKKIAVASTGVIGKQLDMSWISNRFEVVFKNLGNDRQKALAFAKSIMTTDKFVKECAFKVDDAIVAGIAKGAGMICPNMATMLAFIFTNAHFSSDELQLMLNKVVERTFNTTVVDGDTSTNDMVLLVSVGNKKVDSETFEKALNEVCFDLAKKIAKDGEGATKLIQVIVEGAKNDEDAFKAAKSIVSSLLVKTAIFGNDPNWGRIVAALGYSNAEVDENLTLAFKNEEKVVLVERGKVLGNEEKARKLLEKSNEVQILIDLHKGNGKGFAIGCDLSYDYVKINAEYTT